MALDSRSPLARYWYVVAESAEVRPDAVLSRRVLDEALAVWRDPSGAAVVAVDRCLHRCSKLSSGQVHNGALICRYHGWVYGEAGRVTAQPSEGPDAQPRLKARTFRSLEQDGYVYACLMPDAETPAAPILLPRPAGCWKHIRLQNAFKNSVANCAENYIDVPHTTFVHSGVFRKPAAQPIDITLTRQGGMVRVDYHGETLNLGHFSWLLNSSGKTIAHTDHFFAPHTTSVHYHLPNGFSYYITSQSIPRGEMDTLVYTDISYNFGIWSDLFDPITRLIVRHQARTVIDQDISILNEQGEVIARHGEKFVNTTADSIHVEIHAIIAALSLGAPLDPAADFTRELRIYV